MLPLRLVPRCLGVSVFGLPVSAGSFLAIQNRSDDRRTSTRSWEGSLRAIGKTFTVIDTSESRNASVLATSSEISTRGPDGLRARATCVPHPVPYQETVHFTVSIAVRLESRVLHGLGRKVHVPGTKVTFGPEHLASKQDVLRWRRKCKLSLGAQCMALERSLEDRILQAFLDQLGEGGTVPSQLIPRLSALLREHTVITSEHILQIIRESVLNDAEA